MHKDKFDVVLGNILKTESEQIIVLKTIIVPSIDESIEKLLNNLEEADIKAAEPVYSSKRKRGTRFMRKFAIIASILIISLVLSFIYEIPQVNAFKFGVIKTLISLKDSIISITHTNENSNTAEQPSQSSKDDAIVQSLSPKQAEKELPFHLLMPAYLPQEYILKNIEYRTYPDKMYIVEQVYVKGSKEIIKITQTVNIKNENMTTFVNPSYSSVEVVTINGMEVTLIDSGGSFQAIWYDNETKFNVVATAPKNEIVFIVKGLK